MQPGPTAAFVLAALEGSTSLAKSAQDEEPFRSNMRMLAAFLEKPRQDPQTTKTLERKEPA